MTEAVIGEIGYFKYKNAVFFAFTYDLQICQDPNVIRNSYFVLLQGKYEIESTFLYDFIDKSGKKW